MEVRRHPAPAQLANSLLDLTDLTDDCDATAIDRLCARAREHGTAAVCVWPDFVARSAGLLADVPTRVATVVDFPTGTERAHAVGLVTADALANGADEIDVVLPYAAFAAGDHARSAAMLDVVGARTADAGALMKVILETGELVERGLIGRAADFAIEHGADFVKTSTGKSPVSATPEAARVMLEAIAASGRPVGLKPSGGIRTAADADVYLDLAESILGVGWPTPATFRFGASGVLDALVAAVDGDPNVTTSATY